MECAMWPREMVQMECAMWLGGESWFNFLNFRLYTCITRVIRLRHIMECAMWPREMVSHDWMEQAWFCNMWTLPIYADFQFRQVLPFPFILITLSSLAIPTKSFLFSPFSFYEGIQDLDSMARNIQIFILSVRHQYHLGAGLPSLHHPVLALSWDIAPPLLLVLF